MAGSLALAMTAHWGWLVDCALSALAERSLPVSHSDAYPQFGDVYAGWTFVQALHYRSLASQLRFLPLDSLVVLVCSHGHRERSNHHRRRPG